MGTNYYLMEKPHCPTCGRGPDEGLHIGKSSFGWCFSLHVYPVEHTLQVFGQTITINDGHKLEDYGMKGHSIMSPADWAPLWEKYGIINEYGDPVSVGEMLDIIENRFPRYAVEERHHDPRNIGEIGARTGVGGFLKKDGRILVRHYCDGSHCIGTGDGTWDMIVGEFF